MDDKKILVAKKLSDGNGKSINDFDAVFIIESDKKTTDKLIEKWVGNAHLRVIPAENQDEVLKREMDFFLGIPEPVEIERKFLIEYPDIDMLINNPHCKKVEISQTYLKYAGQDKLRVRKRVTDGQCIYIKTIKKKISDIKRTEIEELITADEYDRLINDSMAKKCSISKDRYCLMYKNQYFELDVFPFWNDKAILEIELKDEDDKIELPQFVNVIREVTEDANYTNFALAKSFNK